MVRFLLLSAVARPVRRCPYFQQTAAQAANKKHSIVTQAWSPIGGITFYPGWGEDRRSTLDDPTIGEIAEKHSKTPAQVMLRWHLDQGRQAIPKSTNPARIAENLDVLGFELTADELAAIDALDTGVRGGPDPESFTITEHGAEIPEA
ncbi:aldo/keto reductase [Streptomyces sp. NPDC096354]|uniref:aldo/keto reductase n=1 Tax=Streptomyces sp. NPDC096354 TaxID=3366088 RepID=UPI0038119D2D